MIWRFVDGKPGHENQTAGLLRALGQLHNLDVHTLPVLQGWKAFLHLIFAGFPRGIILPSPDVIIGAGHATHLSMLAARRARGGRTVVLMKPSLPTSWFDLCVVPEHDGVPASNHVLITRGVLNSIVPGKEQDARKGLFLIGGPSSHYQWDEHQLVSAIHDIIAHDDIKWILTTSRRTPDTTLDRLRSISSENLEIIPWQQTDRDWLPARLCTVSRAWITEDSVSMLYEALTSGAACGVLPVPHKGNSRVSDSVWKLIKAGMVTGFSQWESSGTLAIPSAPINEAVRAAKELSQRWFSS